MQVGIIGFENVGRETLFSVLTQLEVAAQHEGRWQPHIGVSKVQDPRVLYLSSLYNPKKTTHAEITYTLVPAIIKDSQEHNEKCFAAVRNTDALCHVVRVFEHESVFHPEGSVDPDRDIELMDLQMAMLDLDLIEKRLAKIKKERTRKSSPLLDKEEALLIGFKEHLEQGGLLRECDISDDDFKLVKGYCLLTLKRLLIVLNIGEEDLGDQSKCDSLVTRYSGKGRQVLVLCVEIEKEISQLEEADRQMFMKELGIGEPAVHRMTRVSYDILGLISFFTVGPDEVRAWTVSRGVLAPAAAGTIHSDLERGFIRVEVMKYDEFVAAGSEAALRQQGKLYVKGKDYEVCDGDILHVLFNV